LIVGLVRGGRPLIIPQGEELVRAGDQLILSTLTARAQEVAQFFEVRGGISSIFAGRKGEQVPPDSTQTQVELDAALEETKKPGQDPVE